MVFHNSTSLVPETKYFGVSLAAYVLMLYRWSAFLRGQSAFHWSVAAQQTPLRLWLNATVAAHPSCPRGLPGRVWFLSGSWSRCSKDGRDAGCSGGGFSGGLLSGFSQLVSWLSGRRAPEGEGPDSGATRSHSCAFRWPEEVARPAQVKGGRGVVPLPDGARALWKRSGAPVLSQPSLGAWTTAGESSFSFVGRRLSLLPRVTSWHHRARVERVLAPHENHGPAVRGHFLGGQ